VVDVDYASGIGGQEPAYTVRLADGAERSTVAGRLSAERPRRQEAPATQEQRPAPPVKSKSKWRPPDWCKPALLHKPVLEMHMPGRGARTMAIAKKRVLILGRNGQVSDVVIDDPSISRAQAAIINSSSATFLQDMDSAHGTWLDLEGRLMAVPQLGDRLDPESEPTKLVEGATFRLGSSNTVFRVVGVEPEVVDKWKPPPWTEPPSRPCALDVRSNTYSNPYLAHRLDEDGGDVDETIRLSGRCTVIGRSSQLADLLVRHESLSRQHAALMHAEKDTFLQDLGSASGTFIDGKRLPANEPTKLAEGAQITFGDSKATYTYRANIGSSGSSGGKRKR